jgi:predicted ATP-grasp superfamily ATP-dependent carboligase
VEDLARRVLELTAEGRLVSDALLVELAKAALDQPDVAAARRVLDGGDGVLVAGVELAGLLVGARRSRRATR